VLFQVKLHYATFGIVTEYGIVTKVAPIGKWCLGKSIKVVQKRYGSKIRRIK